MRDVVALPRKAIQLGLSGENERERVIFDLEALLAEFPGASLTLLNMRPGDSSAYPCANIEINDGKLYWTITSAELTTAGGGFCQLIAKVNNVIAKSLIYDTEIYKSLPDGAEIPEPWEAWQTEFTDLKDAAEQAADDAEAASLAIQNMGVESETLVPGSPLTVTKSVDPETGAVTLTFGLTQGDKGDQGYSPTVAVTNITGGHRVVVTDEDGDHAFDVMDGSKGDTGNGIASVTLNNDFTLTLLYTNGNSATVGPIRGAKGEPGAGVPSGGAAGQMLVKHSLEDYDGEWQDQPDLSVYTTKEYVDTAISNINSMSVHVCTAQEYNSETGVPTIQNPDTSTFYLVPGGESNNLYIEWVYVGNAWERFGSADIDLSGYALNEDIPVVKGSGTASVQNKQVGSFPVGTASGNYSIAIGQNVRATGNSSAAFGFSATQASGMGSFAAGWAAIASGAAAHAEGSSKAIGNYSHAEGDNTNAKGRDSHAEGSNTSAAGAHSHAAGQYNVEDSYSSWPEWVSSTAYGVGDKVKVTVTENNTTTVQGYVCKTANSDAEFTAANWTADSAMNYVEIIGNGTANNARSNARALDWSGNEYLAGDLYVHANSNSTGGNKVLVAADVPVESGTGVGSIQSKAFRYSNQTLVDSATGVGSFAVGLVTEASGLASIAIGSQTQASGAASFASGANTRAIGICSHADGMSTVALGKGSHSEGLASLTNAWNLTSTTNPLVYSYSSTSDIVPYVGFSIHMNNTPNLDVYITNVDVDNQQITVSATLGELNNRGINTGSHGTAIGLYTHTEGYDTIAYSNYQHVQGQSNSVDALGTYAHIVGNGTDPWNRSNAYALTWTGDAHYAGDVYVGCNADSSGGTKLPRDVQVAGTSVVTNGVANIPIAGSYTAGTVKIPTNTGLQLLSSDGRVAIRQGTSAQIKAGTENYYPTVPSTQHESVFYGLSKAAGVDLANETVTFGTYPSAAKTAIKNMIGVQEGLEVVRLI